MLDHHTLAFSNIISHHPLLQFCSAQKKMKSKELLIKSFTLLVLPSIAFLPPSVLFRVHCIPVAPDPLSCCSSTQQE